MNCFVRILLCTSISLFFSCCERDIELDLPIESKLVILSNFTPDSIFRISLSTSIPINNSAGQTPMYPSDASIQLYENDLYVGDFIYRAGDALVLPAYVMEAQPREGFNYSIRAELPNYPTIMASNIIPPRVELLPLSVDNIFVMEDTITPGVFSYGLSTKLNALVSADSQQYFHVMAWRNIVKVNNNVTSKFKKPLGIVFDPNVSVIRTLHEKGYLLDADAFRMTSNGISIHLSFMYDANSEWKTPVYIALRHVSEDYYRFHKSVGEQELTADKLTLFSAEAFFIHNNIQGGIGNFSGYSVSLDSLAY